MTYGYIYKTTIDNPDSTLHGHFYIGQHRKSEFDTRYFGSGYKIKNYIIKYGTSGLIAEVLAWAHDEDDINNLEADYVHEGLLTDEMCLNLVTGGKYKAWSLESRKKASMNMLGMKNHRYGTHHTDEYKKAASVRGRKFRHKPETLEQIKISKRNNPYIYTNEARKKMSEKAKITKNATGYKWTTEQVDSHRPRLILSTKKVRKIANEELPKIDKMLSEGVLQRDVAKIYGVAPHTISWTFRVRIPEFKKLRPEIFNE